MKPKREWTAAKKALASLGIVVAALAFCGHSWWTSLNVLPTVIIPTPKMPSPNALDYFIQAGQSLVDEKKVSYAISSRHSGQGDDRPSSLHTSSVFPGTGTGVNTPAPDAHCFGKISSFDPLSSQFHEISRPV